MTDGTHGSGELRAVGRHRRDGRSTGRSWTPGTRSTRCTASTPTIRVTERGMPPRQAPPAAVPAALGGRRPAGRRRGGAPAPVRARPTPTQIRAMHGRMSARTLYLRYFSVVAQVSDKQVAIFTDVDHVNAVGLVAVLGGQIIAAGTYHRNTGRRPRRGRGRVRRRGRPAAPRARLDPARAPRRGRPGTRHPPVHRRGAEREHPDGQGFHRRRVLGAAASTTPGSSTWSSTSGPPRSRGPWSLSREHRAEARSIARLLSPRSIAVIGASTEPTKLGHAVLVNLLRSNFSGPVYPVNPDTAVGAGGAGLRRRSPTFPTRSTWPWSPCRPRPSPRWSSPAGSRACTGWW